MKLVVDNFCLKDSITSGQFFRYYSELDGSYTVILKDRVINIIQDGDNLTVSSSNNDNLKCVIYNFFDLNTDYNLINNEIIKKDNSIINIVNVCSGFKILRMEPFETIISYIISANNSVTNIKKCVNLISERYGKKIIFNNKEYYLFPTINELKDISLEKLKEMKLGFRAKYVFEVINKINNNELDLDYIDTLNTIDALKYLMNYKGIGLKVASCILLFSYNRYDVFPIDTWVRKSMKELYGLDDVKQIKEFINDKHPNYSGIFIQYLFNSKRNK